MINTQRRATNTHTKAYKSQGLVLHLKHRKQYALSGVSNKQTETIKRGIFMAVQKNKKDAGKAKATARGSKAGTPAKKAAATKKSAATAKKTAKGTPGLKESLAKLVKAAQSAAANKDAPPNQQFDYIMDMIATDLNSILEMFMEVLKLFTNLSPAERARLVGAGVRNYGFIEKARDIARDNPTFLPPNFDVDQFSADLESFDKVRQVYLVGEKLETMASDKMLLMSNDLYRESLRVYNTLKEQSKARVPGARDLFMALETFFKKRRTADRPPTEAEEIRRARGIIKGTVEGEMLLKNEKAKKTGGVHEVIEDIHKDQIAGKESAEFNEKE
jgi:hypothetical protein